MNDYILCFEIASLPIYVILLIATISRKLTKGRSNNLLMLMLGVSFLAAISDVVAVLFSQRYPLTNMEVRFLEVMNYLYFLARTGINVVYTFYLFSVTRKWYQIRAFWKKILILIPYIVTVYLLIDNFGSKAIFYITAENGYQRGEHIIAIYALATVYMIVGIIYLIVHRKLLSLSEWISLATLYVFNGTGVIIQYFRPELLVENYFTSMTLLFVVLFVQKAERQIDMNTGLPGFFAFRSEMGKIETTGQEVQVIIVSINNADEFRRYLGDKAYFEYMHSIERLISVFCKKEKLETELYFETPGNFYIICEDIDYNPVQAIPEVREKIREKNGNITETGASIDLKIVNLTFPEDISSVKELIQFGHDFTRFAHNKIYYHADQIIEERSYQIENRFDEILNRAIDNQKLLISYVPIWSVKEDKVVFTEAVTSVYDDIFGEIDQITLEKVSKARGTGAILDAYAIEQVFAYVGAGNLTQNGAEYVIVHLSEALGMQKNFTDRIWNLRSQYKVHPEQICFAIKEYGYDNMGEGFDDNIKKLALQGYRLALDGYGTGYSDIKHIVEFPFCAVRLDPQMVTEVTNENGKTLLAGMIQMLKNIPLSVVVQGIDDEETKDAFSLMGCDLMQGDYFKE